MPEIRLFSFNTRGLVDDLGERRKRREIRIRI